MIKSRIAIIEEWFRPLLIQPSIVKDLEIPRSGDWEVNENVKSGSSCCVASSRRRV